MSATAAAGATGAAFGIFGPGFLEVRKMDPGSAEDWAEFRVGEAFAAGSSLVVAGAIAIGEKTWKPFAYWAAVTIGICLAYEYAFWKLGHQ